MLGFGVTVIVLGGNCARFLVSSTRPTWFVMHSGKGPAHLRWMQEQTSTRNPGACRRRALPFSGATHRSAALLAAGGRSPRKLRERSERLKCARQRRLGAAVRSNPTDLLFFGSRGKNVRFAMAKKVLKLETGS